MSFKNQEKCPVLGRNGVHLNQSAYSPKANGCPLPLEQRNEIKNICLQCERVRCVYEYGDN